MPKCSFERRKIDEHDPETAMWCTAHERWAKTCATLARDEGEDANEPLAAPASEPETPASE